MIATPTEIYQEEQAIRNRCEYKKYCPTRQVDCAYCDQWEEPYDCDKFKRNREYERVAGKTIEDIVKGK